MNRYWISLSLGQRCSGSKKIFLAVWYIRWLTLNLLRNKIKSGNRISPSLVCLRHNDVSGGGSFANKKREIPINLTARWPQNEKNTLRDGGRSIPQICQFRYTTALLRPALVHQRVLLLVTELPKLAKISQSHPTAFHRLLDTEFGKIFHHYETESVDNDEEWRQVKLATRRPLGARLSTLVSLSQSRGDFPSQPPRIYYADFLGFLRLKIVNFLSMNTRSVNHHRASIPSDLFL